MPFTNCTILGLWPQARTLIKRLLHCVPSVLISHRTSDRTKNNSTKLFSLHIPN